MKKSKQRIWTRAELTIAYYIAKWDFNGLKISEKDLAEGVIGDTTVRSLQMQVANFRFILGYDGYVLKDYSKAQSEVATVLQNKTITQVRKIVDTIIEKSDVKLEKLENRRNNVKVNEVKNKLNKEAEELFAAKLFNLRKYRRLTPVKK